VNSEAPNSPGPLASRQVTATRIQLPPCPAYGDDSTPHRITFQAAAGVAWLSRRNRDDISDLLRLAPPRHDTTASGQAKPSIDELMGPDPHQSRAGAANYANPPPPGLFARTLARHKTRRRCRWHRHCFFLRRNFRAMAGIATVMSSTRSAPFQLLSVPLS